jgi:cell division protein FtsQ
MRGRNNRRKSPPRERALPRVPIRWHAILMPLCLLAIIAVAVLAVRKLLDQPVSKLTIVGDFERVTPLEIEAALSAELDKGFLSLSLKDLRRRLEQLEWIDAVRIGRRWPDELLVDVTEHTAAARWGVDGLLNILFTENARHTLPELPKLDGPPGSERQVARYYLEIRGRLVEAHLSLDTLRMDDRGALYFVLSSGQEIRIGRQDISARIARFFDVVAPALGHELDRVRYVDLRYTNGFSVAWSTQRRKLDENRELLTNG